MKGKVSQTDGIDQLSQGDDEGEVEQCRLQTHVSLHRTGVELDLAVAIGISRLTILDVLVGPGGAAQLQKSTRETEMAVGTRILALISAVKRQTGCGGAPRAAQEYGTAMEKEVSLTETTDICRVHRQRRLYIASTDAGQFNRRTTGGPCCGL